MEQSKPFSDDGSLVDKSGFAGSNSYLEEVDRQLIVEVKAKTQAEIEIEVAEATKKSQLAQLAHSKKVYNSAIKAKRNEKSLIKGSASMP